MSTVRHRTATLSSTVVPVPQPATQPISRSPAHDRVQPEEVGMDEIQKNQVPFSPLSFYPPTYDGCEPNAITYNSVICSIWYLTSFRLCDTIHHFSIASRGSSSTSQHVCGILTGRTHIYTPYHRVNNIRARDKNCTSRRSTCSTRINSLSVPKIASERP